MSEEVECETFVCSVCNKERRIEGSNLRRKVSYIETNKPPTERAVCFACIRRVVKALSNAER